MSLDPRTPIIIGTGQVAQHAIGLDDAKDPIALISDAITLASQDAGLTSIPNPDALRIVSLLSWRYTNPAYFVAQDLRLEPRELGLSATGGNTPQMLVNIASQQIQRGEIDLVFLAGGETSRTRKRARAAGVELDWRTTDIAPTMVTEEKKLFIQKKSSARCTLRSSCIQCLRQQCARMQAAQCKTIKSTSANCGLDFLLLQPQTQMHGHNAFTRQKKSALCRQPTA